MSLGRRAQKKEGQEASHQYQTMQNGLGTSYAPIAGRKGDRHILNLRWSLPAYTFRLLPR